MILTDENGKKYKVNNTDPWRTDYLKVEPIEEKPKFVWMGIVHDRGDWNRFVSYDGGVIAKNISWQILARTIANFIPEAKWATLNHSQDTSNSVLSFWKEKPRYHYGKHCPDDIWAGSSCCESLIIDCTLEEKYSACIIEIERT